MMKQFIQVGDYQAAYTVQGYGKPLILLHGFFGDSWTLNSLVTELQSEFQCFNLELLGFGDSSKPKINYLIGDQVEFLQAFIQALEFDQFYLVGYSYGAWVAAAYAIAHSRKNWQKNLLGIALLAPTGIRDDSFTGRYNHLKPLLWETFLVDQAIKIVGLIANLMGQKEYFQTIQEARKSIISQPAAAAFLKSRLKPEDAVDTVENDLHDIKCFSVILAAGEDKHIPMWHCKTYQEKIAQAQLYVVANADHDFVKTHSHAIGNILVQNFINHPIQTILQPD